MPEGQGEGIGETFYMADSNFFLGRAYDPIKQVVTEREIKYDPADLTTHAVVTGMTGSEIGRAHV